MTAMVFSPSGPQVVYFFILRKKPQVQFTCIKYKKEIFKTMSLNIPAGQ